MIRIGRHVWLCTCLGIVVWPLMGRAKAEDRQMVRRARYEIAYATYLGGDQWDQAREIIPYPDGTVLVGGMTSSPNMPTTLGVVQPEYAGNDPARGHGGVFGGDAFLVRLGPDGRKILAATYFGGSKQERGVYGMLPDSQGNIVIGSATRSPDMPTTKGSYQPKYGGGQADMYAAKLSGDMKEVLWCTYVGRSNTDWPRGGLALDDQDNVYLVGGANSKDFPTTEGAYQRALKGKTDGFVTKLSSDGKSFVLSSLLGGSGGEFFLMPTPDGAGNIFVVGHTTSSDLATTPGALQPAFRSGKRPQDGDGVLAVLSPDGSRLVYATFLGGSGDDLIRSVALGPNGEVYLVGSTSSRDFPVTPNASQTELSGNADAFVVKLLQTG